MLRNDATRLRHHPTVALLVTQEFHTSHLRDRAVHDVWLQGSHVLGHQITSIGWIWIRRNRRHRAGDSRSRGAGLVLHELAQQLGMRGVVTGGEHLVEVSLGGSSPLLVQVVPYDELGALSDEDVKLDAIR